MEKHVIVLTGGIACGKSTVAEYIRVKGYELLDCDQIVHDAYKSDKILIGKISEKFGKSILSGEKIDRDKLRKLALEKKEGFKILNSIVHKRVVEILLDKMNNSKEELIFLDIPLMFEVKDFLINNGLTYDEIWFVYVNKDIQKSRLIKRAEEENKNIEEVLNMISKQISNEEKKSMADQVIDNNGSLEDTYKIIDELLEKLDER